MANCGCDFKTLSAKCTNCKFYYTDLIQNVSIIGGGVLGGIIGWGVSRLTGEMLIEYVVGGVGFGATLGMCAAAATICITGLFKPVKFYIPEQTKNYLPNFDRNDYRKRMQEEEHQYQWGRFVQGFRKDPPSRLF